MLFRPPRYFYEFEREIDFELVSTPRTDANESFEFWNILGWTYNNIVWRYGSKKLIENVSRYVYHIL